jgi:hypothetical protein
MNTNLDEEIAKVRREIDKLAEDIEAYLKKRKLDNERNDRASSPAR